MEDNIEWKEAKGGQSYSSDSDDQDELDADKQYHDIDEEQDEELVASEKEHLDFGEEQTLNYNNSAQQDVVEGGRASKQALTFSHNQINLSLRRNIVALADSSQHKPKPTYASDSKIESFDSWIEHAIVAISPNADMLLFASHTPQKTTFLAKLRMEPINQYTTKPLEVPLDYKEQVTSLLCLPIMSTQKTAIGLVDWTALVIGLSSGYVKFYTEQSICLLSFKFCDEPVLSLKCQTLKNNSNARTETHFPIIIDELLITYRSSAIAIDGISLHENLRISKDEVVRSRSSYEPAYNLSNLPSILLGQKWKFEDSRGSVILDAELLGTRKQTKFDNFMSESIDSDYVPTKASARTLAFVGRNPFVSCYRESSDTSSHSYTEIIGSIFSLWNKPQPSKLQLTEITKPSTISLFDNERLATSIVSSPDKRLAAITDDFGRVSLIDVTNWVVIRIWKGYRSAQCGWIEVKRNPEQRACSHASFLVIYAPKRGLLEVWSAQRGPRVAAFNVGKNCRLLYSNYKMLNMRAEVLQKNGVVNHLAEQSYSSNCYLLNAKSEKIFSVEVPYTYSLYKYGDLMSRDHLLIGELVGALQQDSEVELISEILHRIALAESLQTSIQKIVNSLTPEKIVPIMENLIIKTVKNYDNHSGEVMTDDDISIIELCKRIIRLSVIFKDLSQSTPNNITLPDVNQRLIDEYEEHPQEIDEFSNQLGWSTTEVLRYLSLLALDRSYRGIHLSNPWPNLGEPLAWCEFISCFDLNRKDFRRTSKRKDSKADKTINTDQVSVRLQEFNNAFLSQEKVIKTALFMYNRLSEAYYRSSQSATKANKELTSLLTTSYNYLEPSSRLALLFQFWLSTKLCNHWKMWNFLQNQVGLMSDELKVIAMAQDDDTILIDTWKQIYNLILESDNIFSAIIATATIKSDTLRMIQDNEKREKLLSQENNVESKDDADDEEEKGRSSVDWECLCIDAERMSILSQQLEDVFLLNLLLKYSVKDGHLVDGYLYRVPRISVANILRSGPTVVSELVAQWAVQSEIKVNIFTEAYGAAEDQTGRVIISDCSSTHTKLYSLRSSQLNNEEHAKELLHHTKTCYPRSLEPENILLNCIWEYCRQWTASLASTSKIQLLKKAYDCLTLIESVQLKHKISNVAFKTFFQRTFERLVGLVETNSTIVNVKGSRLRDTFTRKELNMGEECLEDFVKFCCDLSEFMLQTSSVVGTKSSNDQENVEEQELKSRLLTFDSWWATPSAVKMLDKCNAESDTQRHSRQPSLELSKLIFSKNNDTVYSSSLARTILSTTSTLDVNMLVELNRLANLMNLIFKLKIVRAYPMSLMGEESRQILKIDLHQMPSSTGESNKNRTRPIGELRQKFARKCILNIVTKMSDETNEFNGDDDDDEDDNDNFDQMAHDNNHDKSEDIDSKSTKSKFDMDSRRKKSTTSQSSSSRDLVKFNREDNGNNNRKHISTGSKTLNSGADLLASARTQSSEQQDAEDEVESLAKSENNESMVLFTNLLSLANEWQLNCDELYLELVFELYRCNHDKMAAQISTRTKDHQTLATGLLKISSQRVLVLFGLSPNVSGPEWRRRIDKWSIFQPNVVAWLKSIQHEEMRREIACLSFSSSLKTSSNTFGVEIYLLHQLRRRTKLILEYATNHLEGQAARLAYDLLELLESQKFDKVVQEELAKESTIVQEN